MKINCHTNIVLYSADFFISTELIPKRRLKKWIQRPGFHIRKVAILKWIVLGNILTLAYKKSLLSSLVPIHYEDTIDNIYDLDKSGLPIILAKGLFITKYISEDPSKVMTQIYKRAILVPMHYPPAPWILEMLANLVVELKSNHCLNKNLYIYRVANGTAVCTADNFNKGIFPDFHWFKDPILTLHASHIVPKGEE